MFSGTGTLAITSGLGMGLPKAAYSYDRNWRIGNALDLLDFAPQLRQADHPDLNSAWENEQAERIGNQLCCFAGPSHTLH
jgi:hypothetical protein